MSLLLGARRPRALMAAVAVPLAIASLASAASAATFPSTYIAPKRGVLEPAGYFSGVYAAEDTCGCHTVGAGDAATGVSWNTGSSFKAYSGCTRLTPTIANGTGSLYLWIHGHSDDVTCTIAAQRQAAATPAGITGTTAVAGLPGRQAWTSTQDQKSCIALQASDGYGQGCYSQADVDAGKAWTALGPSADGPDQVVVAAIVPAGAPTPVIEDADGTEQALTVVDGVATAVVPASAHGTLRMWNRSIPLDPLMKS